MSEIERIFFLKREAVGEVEKCEKWSTTSEPTNDDDVRPVPVSTVKSWDSERQCITARQDKH